MVLIQSITRRQVYGRHTHVVSAARRAYITLSSGGVVTVALIIVGIFHLLGLMVVVGTLHAIFDTVLYLYAGYGLVPEGFTKDLLQQTFTPSPVS